MNEERALLHTGGAWVGPLFGNVVRANESRYLGMQIGPFRTMRALGSGGMGVVYLAERTDGQFKQEVAIKFLSAPGMRDRFLREREVLAQLSHPHIAHLIDGGITKDDTHYLIMEYVRGMPISEYCHVHVPTLLGRLKLLLDAANAIAYAHQSQVIHRDIKPSNLLVTDRGLLKLLDFGIAKLMHDDPADGSSLTLQGLAPLTPEYAAPEQFRGEQVTVATDTYQFGVLAYRILAGRSPYDPKSVEARGLAHTVLHGEPVPFSQALRESVTDKGSGSEQPVLDDYKKLRSLTRGIDHLLSAALAKNAADRYASMEALSHDLEALIHGRPGSIYRRFYALWAKRVTTSRHRSKIVGLTLVFCIAVTVPAMWQLRSFSIGQELVEAGHGIQVRDLHNSNPETAAIARSAFKADAEGDRNRAIALLQAAHRSDSTTPVPALFLSFFALATGDRLTSDRWFAQADARIRDLKDPYIELLRDYIAAERQGSWNQIMRTSGALLDLRPGAWSMRVARAHMLMARGMREAALEEAQAVEVLALDHRKIEMLLADRAALGDAAGAEAALARLPQDPNSPSLAYLRARIAYSRGELSVARSGFVRAVELGLEHNRLDLVVNGQRLAGLLAMMLGDTEEARIRMTDAMKRLVDLGRLVEAGDLGLAIAQLHALNGRPDEAAAAIAHARVSIGDDGRTGAYGLLAELYAIRLLGRAGDGGVVPDSGTENYDMQGAADLLKARRAHASNDPTAAKQLLEAAIDAGVLRSVLAEETRLLASELSLSIPSGNPIDPPYPPLSRLVSRWLWAAQVVRTATD